MVEEVAEALPTVAARGAYHQVAILEPLAEGAEDDTLSRAFEHLPGQSRDDGPGAELMEDLLEEGRDTDDMVELPIAKAAEAAPVTPKKRAAPKPAAPVVAEEKPSAAGPGKGDTESLAVNLAELMREADAKPDDNRLQARYDAEYDAFTRKLKKVAPAERKRLTGIAAGRTPRPNVGPAKQKGKVVFASPMGGRKKRMVRR